MTAGSLTAGEDDADVERLVFVVVTNRGLKRDERQTVGVGKSF